MEMKYHRSSEVKNGCSYSVSKIYLCLNVNCATEREISSVAQYKMKRNMQNCKFHKEKVIGSLLTDGNAIENCCLTRH